MAGKVGDSSLRPRRAPRRIDRMRTVLVVLFDDVQSLDVTGPVEVFAGAERQRPGSYRLLTASPDGAPVRTSSGLTLAADHALDDAPAAPPPARARPPATPPARPPGWGPAGPAPGTAPTPPWSPGCAGTDRAPNASSPFAPAPCCWPTPACWRAAGSPPTGPCAADS